MVTISEKKHPGPGTIERGRINMGGYGSGRWSGGKWDAKTLVEDCRFLDVGAFVRDRVIAPGQSRRGSWTWSRNGQKVAAVGFEANVGATNGTLRLAYLIGRAGGEKTTLDYVVPLVTTALVSGGRRWWFLCPACRRGEAPCRRRVAKLYLPPGGRIFACRRCHELAYTSSRESRRYDCAFAGLAAEMGLPFGTVKRQMMRRGRAEREEVRLRKRFDDLIRRWE
jgi:hypothetical protein